MGYKKICSFLLILFIISLFTGCRSAHPGLTPKPFPESLNITQIGENYLNKPDVTGHSGYIFVDPTGNIWIHSRMKQTLFKYSLSGIQLPSTPFYGGLVFGDGQVYGLLNDTPQQLYSISSSGLTFIENATNIPIFNSTTCINSTQIITPIWNDTSSIKFVYTTRGSNSSSEQIYSFDEHLYDVHGSSMDDNNLYVLIWLNSGRYIYRFNPSDFSFKDRFQVTLVLNPDGLIKKSNMIYVYSNEGVSSLTLDDSGKISGESIEFKNLSNLNIRNTYPYNSGFVIKGELNGIEGVFYWNGASLETIDQPDLSGDYLYSTYAIAASGPEAYIPCDKNLKIFENGIYSTQISLPTNGICKLAINKDNTMIATTNSCQIHIIKNGITTSAFGGGNWFGIHEESDGNFVLRTRGGEYNDIARFNPSTKIFTPLFSFSCNYVWCNDIAVLKNGNLIINLDNQIKIYSSSGSLIAQSAFYSLDPGDALAGIEYSFYYDRIFALLISGKLLVINPSTLSLEQTVGLTQSSDQFTDLAVTSDGVIYIVTWPGMAYKVSGGNKVFNFGK